MVKLSTPVSVPPLPFGISLKDKIVVLGSCLCDDLGAKFADAGFDVMANPFGTLYNPLSIENAIKRLDSAEPYTEKDCVEMGAGAGLVCSFEHYPPHGRRVPRRRQCSAGPGGRKMAVRQHGDRQPLHGMRVGTRWPCGGQLPQASRRRIHTPHAQRGRSCLRRGPH